MNEGRKEGRNGTFHRISFKWTEKDKLFSIMSGPVPSKECSEWPNYPTYLCSHTKVQTIGYTAGESLPLGKSIHFESELFKGSIFIRLRDVDPPSYDREDHSAYFKGKKRFWQVIVQGQFKEEINMADLVYGDFYEKPFLNVPRGPIMNLIVKFMNAISPGIDIDVTSDTPKLLAPFGGTQVMRIDLPGNEPKITGAMHNVQEDTSLVLGAAFAGPKSQQKRRRYLSQQKNSSKYSVNPEHVYTMELYDHSTNFGTYHQHAFGNFKVDMVKCMNGQALAFCCFTRDKRMLWKFRLWHERLIGDIKKAKEETKAA